MTYHLTCSTTYEYILRVCTKTTVNIYITNLHEWLVFAVIISSFECQYKL